MEVNSDKECTAHTHEALRSSPFLLYGLGEFVDVIAHQIDRRLLQISLEICVAAAGAGNCLPLLQAAEEGENHRGSGTLEECC